MGDAPLSPPPITGCVCDRCTWRVGGFYIFIYIREWLDMEKKV